MESFDAVLAAARLGEGWAFERIFLELGRPVAAYLRGGGVEDPDGSANEVFLKAFGGIGRFDGGEDRFRAWLFTIAHHVLVDDRRRRSRRPATTALDHDLASDADDVEVALGDERVRAMLAALSPDQREVVLLRLVADLSIEETAAVLGKKPNAVKQLLHRAVRALRTRFEEEGVTP